MIAKENRKWGKGRVHGLTKPNGSKHDIQG